MSHSNELQTINFREMKKEFLKLMLLTAVVVFIFSSCKSVSTLHVKVLYDTDIVDKDTIYTDTIKYTYEKTKRYNYVISPTLVTSQIKNIDYLYANNNLIVAVTLEDNMVINITPEESLSLQGNFAIGKKMSYYKNELKQIETTAYIKTIESKNNGNYKIISVDTVLDIYTNYIAEKKSQYKKIESKTKTLSYNINGYYFKEKQLKDTLITHYDSVSFYQYLLTHDTLIIYDIVTVNDKIEQEKINYRLSKTNIACFKKRIKHSNDDTVYQLKMYQKNKNGEWISVWVNTDESTYNAVHFPTDFYLYDNDWKYKIVHSFPAKYIDKIYSTDKVNVVVLKEYN